MSVRKTKNGKWEYYFMYQGKRYTRSIYKTKKECEKAEKERRKQLENKGNSNVNDNMKISELLDIYFDNYVLKNCRIGSQETYKGFQKNINNYLSDYKVIDLTTPDIEIFIDGLTQKGFTKSHIIDIVRYFKKVLKYAVYPLELIVKNPCDFIDSRSIKGKKSKVDKLPSAEQFDDIMNYVKEKYPDYEIVFELYLGTGLRQSEVLGITWDNVNLEKNTIYICQQFSKRKQLEPLKVEGTERIISITQSLSDKLRKQKQLFPNSQFVCVDKKGKHIFHCNLNYRIGKIKKEVPNCEGFHIHMTRKYHTTLLYSNGINIQEVANRVGHKKTSTTLDVYIKCMGNQEQDIINVLENNLH